MTSADIQTRFEFDAATERRFEDYHRANPHVFELLKRFALEAKRAGHRRLSINMLFERARWQSMVETTGDPWKLNNSHRAFYSRMLMRDVPELRGFFETRRSKADAA